ncbi:arylsulfatase [Vibrio crassostreae]|uniref:sulfatase-like hydrolase/transferase n=1 Tax=Vibrio crassostreae TaxID=246167 RepID=UPI00148D5B4B|nr:sulfatase-like hydrolase/transferase [Vibrio crassostreae]NOI54889.1 sulfatase-like hydrolase/transferase [Vibrio crassostreae]CAK2039964.1 arylsulfatase [Vibrio crassostreae]CAK2042338.1 arylsulfatase [Vibrio crassostreae]CAK2042991.1 arylsulfatase [Vibrio crassostreae]CAK2044011.1 arylsulfatase [Vibrio crassostreae]
MNTKIVISLGLVAPFVAFPSLGAASTEAITEPNQPNILLIVGDDIGMGDLQPFGSEINTPTLNSLAEEGIRFNNFHASPVSSVTRGQLFTGANSIEVGLGSFDYSIYPPSKGKKGYEGYLTRDAVTITELLRDSGYNTYHAGKWHLGSGDGHGNPPQDWGFDQTYGVYSGGSAHWDDTDMYPSVKVAEQALAEGKQPPVTKQKFFENGQQVERVKGIYSDDLYTGKMIEYIEEGKDSGKPFFGYLALTTAHFPLQAPAALIDKYTEMYESLGYEGLKKQRYEQMIEAGVYQKNTPYPADNPITKKWDDLTDAEKKTQARLMATYAAMIEAQDFYIGRVLDYLRETGELENTLVIYMPDNGPEGSDAMGPLANSLWKNWTEDHFDMSDEAIGTSRSSRQLGIEWANASTGPLQWWKWFVSEGGVRVPLIVSPPEGTGFDQQGAMSNTTLSVKDLPMTILDYAGVAHPGSEYNERQVALPSGKSMVPFLSGQADTVRSEDDWFAFELFGNGFVIQGDYKLMKLRTGMYGDGEWHLYNIKEDPAEAVPVEDKHPEIYQDMMATYEQYKKDHNIVDVAEDWNPWLGAAGHTMSH